MGTANEEKAEEPDMNKNSKDFKTFEKAMKKSVLSPGVKDVFIIREKFEIERD